MDISSVIGSVLVLAFLIVPVLIFVVGAILALEWRILILLAFMFTVSIGYREGAIFTLILVLFMMLNEAYRVGREEGRR